MIPTKRFHDAIYSEYNQAAVEKPHLNYETVEAVKVVMLTAHIMLAEMPYGYPHCLVIYKPHVDDFVVETCIELPHDWNKMRGL
ncbi:MAG: hypothetical protein WC216_11150 [Gallionella sp.]|jgi:diadenosine tetraphosphate (Ap4A) HIT family hydrolase